MSGRGVTREVKQTTVNAVVKRERNADRAALKRSALYPHALHQLTSTVTDGEKFLVIKGRALEVKARIVWCLDCDKMVDFEIVKSKVLRKALDRLPK